MVKGIVLVILLTVSLYTPADQGPLLAAASSLRSLWPELVESYRRDTGHDAPRVSFASSGLLSTQIINGAPFELFLSADRASINRLPDSLLASPPTVYATGELRLVVPAGSELRHELSLHTLAATVREQKSDTPLRFAIPNPEHAPYGRAAQEALDSADLWPMAAGQLLAAENAAQTLQFLRSGAVDVALVPQSLVYANSEGIVSAEVPQDSYRAIEHTVALFSHANASGHAFHHWILSSQAHAILIASGLRIPSN